MGNHSPGKFRKQGREAFMSGETNPEDFFDYPKKSWWYKSHLEDFLEGWEEAKETYEENETNFELNENISICPNCGERINNGKITS